MEFFRLAKMLLGNMTHDGCHGKKTILGEDACPRVKLFDWVLVSEALLEFWLGLAMKTEPFFLKNSKFHQTIAAVT